MVTVTVPPFTVPFVGGATLHVTGTQVGSGPLKAPVPVQVGAAPISLKPGLHAKAALAPKATVTGVVPPPTVPFAGAEAWQVTGVQVGSGPESVPVVPHRGAVPVSVKPTSQVQLAVSPLPMVLDAAPLTFPPDGAVTVQVTASQVRLAVQRRPRTQSASTRQLVSAHVPSKQAWRAPYTARHAASSVTSTQATQASPRHNPLPEPSEQAAPSAPQASTVPASGVLVPPQPQITRKTTGARTRVSRDMSAVVSHVPGRPARGSVAMSAASPSESW
jgi:hypothetical protein